MSKVEYPAFVRFIRYCFGIYLTADSSLVHPVTSLLYLVTEDVLGWVWVGSLLHPLDLEL